MADTDSLRALLGQIDPEKTERRIDLDYLLAPAERELLTAATLFLPELLDEVEHLANLKDAYVKAEAECERLREALEEIANNTDGYDGPFARRALEGP